MSAAEQQGESRGAANKTLDIQGATQNGVLVATVNGRVDGSNAQEFQESLEALIADSSAAMVLDLGGLSYISSAGLRVILLISRQMQGKAAKFTICSLTGAIAEVFSLSGFDKIIPIHAGQAEAVAALSS